MVVHTIGHGIRPLEELVGLLTGAGVQTLVDVRRFPGSRRNPQFNRGTLEAALAAALAEPAPALMCAETPWTKCHRRLIA